MATTEVPETVVCPNCNHNVVIKLYQVDISINSSQGHFHTIHHRREPAIHRLLHQLRPFHHQRSHRQAAQKRQGRHPGQASKDSPFQGGGQEGLEPHPSQEETTK